MLIRMAEHCKANGKNCPLLHKMRTVKKSLEIIMRKASGGNN